MLKINLTEKQQKMVDELLEDCICDNIKIFTVYLHKFCLRNIKDCDNPTQIEKIRATHTMLVLAELFKLSHDVTSSELMDKINACMEGCEEGIKILRDLYME
jgi:hypothetical protein